MSIKKRCVICKTKFEPKRSDAVYCSPKCKVKAHYQRGKRSTSGSQAEPTVFIFDEYEQVKKNLGVYDDDLPLIFYCFLRKNLNGKPSVDKIADYINSVWTMDRKLMESNAYAAFEESFLNSSDQIQIHSIAPNEIK